jgi:hypothetical protein
MIESCDIGMWAYYQNGQKKEPGKNQALLELAAPTDY